MITFIEVVLSSLKVNLHLLINSYKMSNKMKHENVQGQRMKSFNFIKVLGEGAWAVVYEAFDEKTNTTVAIKAIPKILMKETPKLE